MLSNSEIFSSTVYGNTSGLTKEQLIELQNRTQELYFSDLSLTTLRTRLPIMPSNQKIAKDK